VPLRLQGKVRPPDGQGSPREFKALGREKGGPDRSGPQRGLQKPDNDTERLVLGPFQNRIHIHAHGVRREPTAQTPTSPFPLGRPEPNVLFPNRSRGARRRLE
jgi:hypothetical protein